MRTSQIPRRAAIAAALLGLLGPRDQETPELAAERPNLVYVFTDEHRWHSMSFTELPELRTPNMERLAEAGTSFDRCISNYPLCSPHRAILLTGKWPCRIKVTGSRLGMRGNNLPLDPGNATIGTVFREAGYRTAYIGKWHLGGEDATPFGFDFSRVWEASANHWSSFYFVDGKTVTSSRYNATDMTDQALEFLERNAEAPFLLMLSLNPPHKFFDDAPEETRALYEEPGALPRRPNYGLPDPTGLQELIDEVGREEALRQRRRKVGSELAKRQIRKALRDGEREEEDRQESIGYHAHVTAVDEELGRVMAKLDELGLTERTILVYSSDHGSMLGSHGLQGKRFPHEESIRTPFLVRWPGHVPAGRRTDALLGTIDILPTLCGLVGLERPNRIAGVDLSPVVLGGDEPRPASQFLMNIWNREATALDAPNYRGVRTERYTYAATEEGPWLLFDDEQDPWQLANRVDDPELADVRRELHELTARWIGVAGDPFELPALEE